MLTTETVPTDLARDLGDGLRLRRATPADAEALASFNGHIHRLPNEASDDRRVAAWTRDLVSGRHPTFKPGDALLVEDRHTGKIVSTSCLISQTWSYDGIEFGVGRPELVGTDPAYRRRGLIRAQFEVLHQLSAERGQLALGITGIPWYYRQFGYEMCLQLGAGRAGFRPLAPALRAGGAEPYRMRPAAEADLPFIADLYAESARRSLIHAVRSPGQWRYELRGRDPISISRRELVIIETPSGEPLGFLAHSPVITAGSLLTASACELKPGVSWLAVTPSVIRYMLAAGEARAAAQRDHDAAAPVTCEGFGFWLGASHPLYEGAGDRLPRVREPYAWQIRVPDVLKFLRHIAPVLERRLAASVAAGHTGELRVSAYRNGIKLRFEHGRLAEIAPWQPSPEAEGEAAFPDQTFLQLLFGYRSLAELRAAFKDCWTDGDEAPVLLNALFPRRDSQFWEIG